MPNYTTLTKLLFLSSLTFTLPLPISLTIKSITIFLFMGYVIFQERKIVTIKELKIDYFVILSVSIFLLDPVFSLIRDDIFFISDTRIGLLVIPLCFLIFKINPQKYYEEIRIGLLYGNITYILIVLGTYLFFGPVEFDYFIFKNWYLESDIYIHHIYSGLFIIISIIQLYFSNDKARNYLIAFLAISLVIVGSKFSFGVLVLIFCIFQMREKYKYYWFIAGAGIISLFYYILYNNNDQLYWSSFTRIKIWKRVFKILNGEIILETVPNVGEFPYLIGVGKYTIKKRLMNYDAHNIFLQELLSNGVIGFFLVALLFFVLFKKISSNKEHLLILLCFFLFGLIENLFELQIGVTSFVFILAIFTFWKQTTSYLDIN